MNDYFLILIRAGLYGRRITDFPALSGQDWKDLLEMARRQTVIGLLYQGISLLPEGYQLPPFLTFILIAEINRIEKENLKIAATSASLKEEFTAAGLHPVMMKGAEVARFYREPQQRECGDIDLYFTSDEFERAASLAGDVKKSPDGSVHYKRDGIDIDQHRRYFDVHTDRLPPVPSPEATLLMLSAHIFKHCMGPGVGLRQICDVAMAYQALKVPPEVLRQCFRDAGLERWNQLLFSFLHVYLEAEPLYEELPDPKPLRDIVFSGGNFGHYATGRKAALFGSAFRRKIGTAFLFLRRIPFSLRYAPREFFPTVGELLRGNL